MMRKIITLILAVLILGASTASAENEKGLLEQLTGLPDPTESSVAEHTEVGPKATELTLMIYLCGSNLEDSGFASRDVLEMGRSGFNPEKVNVLVMAGGSRNWAIGNIPGGTTGIYRIGTETIATLANDGRAYNMGDPATLSSFLNYGAEQFPAEKYALILWDHGGGSLRGVCQDMNFQGDSLSMSELETALRESPFASRKLDWIGFDACLMSTAETANIMAPYANYMIASEETEPGTGWDYSFLRDIHTDISPVDTGARIISAYQEACRQLEAKGYFIGNITLACVDLSKVGELIRGVDEYFSHVDISSDNYAQISRIRREVVSFGRDEGKPDRDFDLVDLGDLSWKLAGHGSSEAADRLSRLLGECVVGMDSNNEECTGLTVYFPFYNRSRAQTYIQSHESLNFSEVYQRFITEFGSYLIANGNGLWGSISTQLKDAVRDNRTVVAVNLSSSQIELIGTAQIVAMQDVGDKATWRLVATQDAKTDYENGLVSGEYVHVNLFPTDANGNPLTDDNGVELAPVFYTIRDDGLYTVEVILVDEHGDETMARLVCRKDEKTGEARIENVYLYDEVFEGYTPRLTGDLSDYVSASYRVDEKCRTYDAEGVLLGFEDWTVIQTREYTWNLHDGTKLMFVKDHLDPETIQVAFRITDVFNNVYLSEPISIANTPGEELPDLQLDYDDRNLAIVDIPSLTVEGDVSIPVTNITNCSVHMLLTNVMVDGVMTDVKAEIYGNGEDDSLAPGESQTARISLSLAEGEEFEVVTFNIVVTDLMGEEVGTVEVTCRNPGGSMP